MKYLVFKKNAKLCSLFLVLSFLFFTPFHSAKAASLLGRILLQVELNGEAWYVNPADGLRYYLGRPADAFSVMRSKGIGITNKDLGLIPVAVNSISGLSSTDSDNDGYSDELEIKGGYNPYGSGRTSYNTIFTSKQKGKILLQVESHGEAWYVNPTDGLRYYLGRPSDAFSIMRSLGLGITNTDLAKISTSSSLTNSPSVVVYKPPVSSNPSISLGASMDRVFEFKYKNSFRTLGQTLYEGYYDAYAAAPKSYSYPSGSDTAVARNSFYALFLSLKNSDTSIDDIILQARQIATSNSWSDDELVEFLMAIVQYIPYDYEKVAVSGLNVTPYYPYETIYLNRGVCSDKTFLAVVILRKLGYGSAIIDFPDSNHSAAGISCPVQYSIENSGYCYIETTNYFPLGVVPKGLNSGVATDSGSNFENIFDASSLGKVEIYQKTTGKTYNLVSNTISIAAEISILDKKIKTAAIEVTSLENSLKSSETEIAEMKTLMDFYLSSGQTSNYNALVPDYNNKVNDYNASLATYREKASAYNVDIARFNQLVKDFYQK